MKIINEKLAKFDSSLEVYVYDHPFKHIVFTSDTLKKLCTITHNAAMKIKPLSNIISGNAQANVGFPASAFMHIPSEMMHGYPIDLFCLISEEYFPEQYNSNGHWNCTPNESTVVKQNSVDLESAILYPHTDNPAELIRENLRENRDYPYDVGLIKLVMYTGNDNIDYSEYGTKLYAKKPEGYDDTGGYSGFNFIKEIEYVNGYGMIWAPGEDTWHGTDFCTNNKHRRIFFTGEFY